MKQSDSYAVLYVTVKYNSSFFAIITAAANTTLSGDSPRLVRQLGSDDIPFSPNLNRQGEVTPSFNNNYILSFQSTYIVIGSKSKKSKSYSEFCTNPVY